MPCGSPWRAAFPVFRTTTTHHCLRATIRCSGSAHCGLEGAWRMPMATRCRPPMARFMFTNALCCQCGRPFCLAVRPVPCRHLVRSAAMYSPFCRLGWQVLQLALNQWVAPVRRSACYQVMNLDKAALKMKFVNKNAMGNAANEHPRMHPPSIPFRPCVAPAEPVCPYNSFCPSFYGYLRLPSTKRQQS